MKKIGMRNIKTSISVFLCIVLLKLLKVDFPFYACIAAIITMEKTIYNSFKIGKNRIVGTIIGALIGLLFAIILPGNALLVAIGICLTIYCCNLLGYKKSITIACIVFIAITTNLKNTNPLTYSINRVLETLFGILITVSVNYFISPPNLKQEIYNYSNKIHKDLIELCGNKFYDKNTEKLSLLYNHIKALEKSISEYEDEYKSPNDNLNLKKYENAITLFYDLYIHLKIVENIKNTSNIPKQVYDNIKILTNIPYKPMEQNEDKELKEVFKYHMTKIGEILNSLNNISML